MICFLILRLDIRENLFLIRKKTFIEEYHEFLEKFEIDFDERYIFKHVDYEED